MCIVQIWQLPKNKVIWRYSVFIIYAALYDEQEQYMLIDYSKIQILLQDSRILFSGMPLDTPLSPSAVENAEKSA